MLMYKDKLVQSSRKAKIRWLYVGDEAIDGYKYKTCIKSLICQKCLTRIRSQDLRHRRKHKKYYDRFMQQNTEEFWDTACKFCKPNWKVAKP